jgi:hypothetical protein
MKCLVRLISFRTFLLILDLTKKTYFDRLSWILLLHGVHHVK